MVLDFHLFFIDALPYFLIYCNYTVYLYVYIDIHILCYVFSLYYKFKYSYGVCRMNFIRLIKKKKKIKKYNKIKSINDD